MIEELKKLSRSFREFESSTDSAIEKGIWNHCATEVEKLIPKHEWQWYMNGTFCRKCGCSIGSQSECR